MHSNIPMPSTKKLLCISSNSQYIDIEKISDLIYSSGIKNLFLTLNHMDNEQTSYWENEHPNKNIPNGNIHGSIGLYIKKLNDISIFIPFDRESESIWYQLSFNNENYSKWKLIRDYNININNLILKYHLDTQNESVFLGLGKTRSKSLKTLT